MIEPASRRPGRGAVACDVMTYLFDKDLAMERLLPLEQAWGGNIFERMARRAEAWNSRPPGAAPPSAAPA